MSQVDLASNRRLLKRVSGLAMVLATALLAGCTVVIVSGPSTVAVGETVVYELKVGSDFGGTADVLLSVIADIPVGWKLVSNTWEGTVRGEPASGSGTVLEGDLCGAFSGPVLPGYQRLGIFDGPFDGLWSTDTATVTLEFEVGDQPAGEYLIYFRFASNVTGGPACSQAAVLTVNRDSITFLEFAQALFDGVGGVDGLAGATDAAVTPDGGQVIATAELDDSLAVFARDPATGELNPTQVLVNDVDAVGLDEPSAVTVSPDGAHVYATAAESDSLVTFSRDEASGELTFVEAIFHATGGVLGLQGVDDVILSPAGDNVYTSTSLVSEIAVFARDEATGELDFLQVLKNNVGGVFGLGGVKSIAVSPDGLYVYGAGSINESLAIFARDPKTGELTFQQAVEDGEDGVDGLRGVSSVAITADGRYLYTAASGPDDIAVFARDAATGELSFVQILAYVSGSGRTDDLELGGSVAIHPSDRQIFITGDIAAHTFVRNAGTGVLTQVEAQFNGDPPNEGLNGVSSVTVTPDGRHLYVTGYRSNSLTAFRIVALFADGFESGDTSRWSAIRP